VAEGITERSKLEPSNTHPKFILRIYPGQKDPQGKERGKGRIIKIGYKNKYYGKY